MAIRSQNDNLPIRQASNLPAYSTDIPMPVEQEEMDIHGYISMFLRRRRLILLTLAAVFVIGMLYTATRKSMYESTAKIVVATNQSNVASSEGESLFNNVQALTGSRSVETQLEIVQSPDLLQEAFNRLSPEMRKTGFKSKDIPTWAYRISQSKDADIIAVTGRAYTPSAAAELAKTITDTYFKRDLRQNNQAIRQARRYAGKKMISAEAALKEANADLSKFKRATGLFAPETQLTKTAEQIAQLSMDIDSAKAEIASSGRIRDVLRRSLADQKTDIVANTTITRNPEFSNSQDKINQLYSERTSLLQEYTPESKEVRNIDNRIKEEESRIKEIAANVVGSRVHARNPVHDTLVTQYASAAGTHAAAAARLSALKSEFNLHKQEAKSLPDDERVLNEKVQRVVLLQRTYEMLSNKYHSLLLSEQAAIPNGMLVSKAGIPKSPAYPNSKSNIVLFFLLGLISSVATALVVEKLDTRLRDQAVVEQMSGAATLSVVPEISRESPRLLDSGEHTPALLESFRILRNNISFTSIDKGLKILAVTSPGRGEGKSTTVTNLAVAMSMEGRRVLLVDGDMRRPSLHTILGISRDMGLSSVLSGEIQPEEAIVPTSMANVSCLPAGRSQMNTTELLNSMASRDLFRKLSKEYDLVLVDCPPSAGLSDVQVISTLADGVLLVVSMNKTQKHQLDITIKMLNQMSAPLIGVVLNRMDNYSSGYGYYYNYYSDTEQDSPETASQTGGDEPIAEAEAA